MRRGLLAILSVALISASLFGFIGTTGAHPVVVDSAPSEWTDFGAGPNEDNTGHIIRNTLGQGEFAWFDEDYDNRSVPSTSPAVTLPFTREVDLRQVRVTGDQQNLSVFISLANLSYVDPNPSALNPAPDLPQIQIAIDTGASGQTRFVAPATITPTLTSPWRYLLQTQFKSGTLSTDLNYTTAPVKVYNNNLVTSSNAGSSVIQKVNNTIELQVPWSAIGGIPAINTPLRFTVVSLRESGRTPSPADSSPTNILDTVSPRAKGAAAGLANTLSELSDGDIDYSFAVRFDRNGSITSSGEGEVFSPLLITEVGLFPTTNSNAGQAQAQWMEVTNVSGSQILGTTLQQYKLGEATQRDSSEGTFKLPNKNLAAGDSILVVRDRSFFAQAYPASLANNSNVYTTVGSGALAPAGTWGGSSLSLRATGFLTETVVDQVVLLDEKDTIVDLVEYANVLPYARQYPDHAPVQVATVQSGANQGLVPNTSLQRCPGYRDTNNRDPLKSDWVVTTSKADQTPLGACTLADVAITDVVGPQNIVVSVTNPTEQNYTISYANNRMAASSVLVTETLPLGMSYKSGSTASTPAGVAEPTVSTVGGRTQLVWSIGNLAAAATGQISFTAIVPANLAEGASTNDVQIGSATREAQADQANNSRTAQVSFTREPAIDLTATMGIVTSGSSASKLYPGGQLVYRATYTNNGAKDANGVTLVDTFPAGLIYISNSKNLPADTSVPGKVTLTSNETLAANAAFNTIEIVFAIDENLASGNVINANTLTVSSPTTPEANAADNTATSTSVTLGTRPPAADLTVTASVKDASKATPDGSIVYTFDYANNGTRDASNVTLAASFPDDVLEYQTNSGRFTVDTTVAGQVKLNVSPLSPGSKGTVDVTFKVKAGVAVGTKVKTQVVISTTSVEAPITNNSSTSAETEIKSIGIGSSNTLYLPVVRKP